jgi:spore germination cell wall hydrolase CwlJ-like protein
MPKMNEALRRADRAVAVAVLLVLGTVAGASATGEDHILAHSSAASLRSTAKNAENNAAVPVDAPITIESDSIAALPSPEEIAMAKLAVEERCLAEVMYYEARGEGVTGQEAVAEVVFHRMHRRGYPQSICGVVYQGEGQGSCQFSFACGGEMHHRKTFAAWTSAKLLAAKIMSGYIAVSDATGGAIAFHAVDVAPDWSASLQRTVQIGNHVFYRPLSRTHAS